ncbi:KN motif and ankyrin repeat domain-containing protein 1-like isoform X2 [Antennarius striatus]|uniref:KN motif and ankyrin repeat domain-containing protein 1-like isoform X2 n=1 Tax=Antennarius striatus TaxID=241820 RepID=UPI0035AF982F
MEATTSKEMSGQIPEDCFPNYLGINDSYHSDVEYPNCVDCLQHGSTIKRLSLKRRPRVGINNVEKNQSSISPSQWHSAESLSSSGDDARLLGMSSTTRGRPPLPPPYGSSLESKPSRNEGPAVPQTLNEPKPQPAARSLTSQRQHSMVERIPAENPKHVELEVINPPQPHPRRRLASFGGISSSGSLSPFTGLGAYNQNNNGNKPTGAGSDMHLSSSLGNRGSTGSLKLSPQSSGRSTPVKSLGPMHLQHVRDQMVIALQRLKELEEQVKIIPILHVKIAVLQEEKRQLAFQLGNQIENRDENEEIWKRAHGTEKADTGNQIIKGEGLEDILRSDSNNLGEFRQLTEEIQALESTLKGRHLQAWHGIVHRTLHDSAIKSLTDGMDKDISSNLSKSLKENKFVCTDQVAMRSVATEVCEDNLGIYTKRDSELDAQQLIVGNLKKRICLLEAELKESTLQTEMSRLKLELQTAGARNRADKASSAKPSTVSTSTEVKIQTASQGVGNHTELKDASAGETKEAKTVGTSYCRPELKDVCTGPDIPMSLWEVRERVETMEKGVGIHIYTNTQGVGMEIKLCNAQTNTDIPVERRKVNYRSVACGDCSVMVHEPKEVVSQGVTTDKVKGMDLGIMATPKTVSQRTNTVSSSVCRFTNTRNAFNTESSTNTIISTKDKHTNTPQTVMRTVSVGSQVKEVKCVPKTCTVDEGTSHLQVYAFKQIPATVPKATRDTGVGFANVNENFLVGLKTRNMASGPSRLPDPIKTRSIGVGEGRIWDFSVSSKQPGHTSQQSSQSQWDPELNHYIEKMQRLLRDHGDLLTQKTTQRDEVLQENRGSTNSKPSCSNKAGAQRGTEVHLLNAEPPANREIQSPFQLSLDSSKCDKANQEICQHGGNESEVKRMIQMLEQQASSALQDRPANASMLRSVTMKQKGDQSCSSNRKSMKFLRVTTGLEPVSSFNFSAGENSEEVERRGNQRLKISSQDGSQAKRGKTGSTKGSKGLVKSPPQQRFKLNERMFSACQALKMHLVDKSASPSRELHDCLQTIQQEWFSVSSQKTAAPETLEDYLSSFRVISPLVLQRIANMADGNGNTALHYSVSHSNFGIVKKLLDAGVCNVDQQNKAGYTPIMLAALAAVEGPEDMKVVEQLFTEGDVNAKASQAGQTALMLAVSHGRMDMVQALLARGAEVNLQDDEGSTALMCASEHGHADIVRLLLAQPGSDADLTDSDDSTALTIALEAGHNDIAVLLYAHSNFSKGQTTAAHHSDRTGSSGGRSVFE